MIDNSWPYVGISRACWAEDIVPTSNQPFEVTLGRTMNQCMIAVCVAIKCNVLNTFSKMWSNFSYFGEGGSDAGKADAFLKCLVNTCMN